LSTRQLRPPTAKSSARTPGPPARLRLETVGRSRACRQSPAASADDFTGLPGSARIRWPAGRFPAPQYRPTSVYHCPLARSRQIAVTAAEHRL